MLMKLNEEKILNYMVARKAFPGKAGRRRNAICVDLNLAWTTVYDALVRLELKGIVRRHSRKNGKVGRSAVSWTLTEEEF